MKDSQRKRVEIVREAINRYRERCNLLEGTLPFLIYRTDNNTVLARGIYGYEATKDKANELRKKLGLKWDQVKFKADRSSQTKSPPSPATTSSRRYEYAPRYNPSKRKRFSGVYDKHGNFIELD